jgi:hypothetical protein
VVAGLDFSDLAGARVNAGLQGWYRTRVEDRYVPIRMIDSNLTGRVLACRCGEGVNMSHSTLAFDRDGR